MSTQFNRELITVVEIDQDYCGNTFGVSPCTATQGPDGELKCWNTYATCTDKDNFNRDSLTLRFSLAQSKELDFYTIPLLQSFSLTPTKVNIGSRTNTMKALGARSSVDIVMSDTIHTDNVVDPYVSERGYDPLTRGTFWTKWLARNPYYTGRALRVKTGFAGQDYSEFTTRHYVIDKITQKGSGNSVSIRALDVLRLADDKKAKCPIASNGELGADISAVDTTMILTSDVIDNYTSGIVRIGSEVITYSGAVGTEPPYTLTGLTRGAYDTEQSSHSEGDTIQECVLFSGPCYEIARDLLVDYGNVDVSYIDYQDWVDEGSLWLSQFNMERLITKPEGVTDILGSLAQSAMFFIWYEDTERKIKFKAIRPEVSEIEQVTYSGNIIAGSFSANPDPEQRASDVWVSYDIESPVKAIKNADSYNRIRARTDSESWSVNEYGERVVYEVVSPWIKTDGQAATVAFRTLSRYRDGYTEYSFTTDIKDKYEVGQVIELFHPDNVGLSGEIKGLRLQIISLSEKSDVIQYKAVKYIFSRNYCFIMPNNSPSYSDATEEQRRTGGFISPTNDGTEYKIL